jgi:hypothetical protein
VLRTRHDTAPNVRWKGFTWACSLLDERRVRLAIIEPGQNRICLMGNSTFEALRSSGEIVEKSRGWE